MTEDGKLKVFSPQELKRLTSIKRKVENEGREGLGLVPLITEDTYAEFKNLLGMNVAKIKREEGLESDPEEDPYCKAFKIAKDYLRRFSSDKDTTGTKSFFYNLSAWSLKVFRPSIYENSEVLQNEIAVGALLVVKVFDMQLGGKLIEGLRGADPKEVMNAFAVQEMPKQSGNVSLFEASTDKFLLPEDQISLNALVNEFASSYCGDAWRPVELGATLGFGAVKELLPKLKLGDNSRKA